MTTQIARYKVLAAGIFSLILTPGIADAGRLAAINYPGYLGRLQKHP